MALVSPVILPLTILQSTYPARTLTISKSKMASVFKFVSELYGNEAAKASEASPQTDEKLRVGSSQSTVDSEKLDSSVKKSDFADV